MIILIESGALCFLFFVCSPIFFAFIWSEAETALVRARRCRQRHSALGVLQERCAVYYPDNDGETRFSKHSASEPLV